MTKLILTFIFGLICSVAYPTTLAVSSDADYYVFYGTYNNVRTPFNIGVNDQAAGSTYRYHFNVAAIEIPNLINYNIGDIGLLKLNLQRFRVPVAVDPSYQGPPSYQFLTSGVSFTIKAVALSDQFSNIEFDSDPLNWYNTNLFNRPTIDQVTFNQSGEVIFNITSALNAWKINPSSNFGIGLVGTFSSIEGTTAQFYSLENTDPLLAPTVSVIPEPTIFEYIIAFVFVILTLNLFKNKH